MVPRMPILTRFLPRSNFYERTDGNSPFMNNQDFPGLRFCTVMRAFPVRWVSINKNQTICGIKELKKDFGSGSNRGKMDFSRG